MRKTSVSLRTLAFMGAGLALAPQTAFAQSADAADSGDVEADTPVIIVTAQGRAQELADVPVAISAVSAETLENSGTTDIRELNQLNYYVTY